MQHLIKLINVINAVGEKNIILFEKRLVKKGKEHLLLKGICTGTFQSDVQAAKSLYQTTHKDTKYTTLKARLEEKLLHFLMVVDFNEQDSSVDWQLENNCKSMLYRAHLLMCLGEKHMSVRLLKKTLSIARNYEFTAIIVEALELLLELYTQEGAINQYLSTKEEFTNFREILYNERTAKLLYQEAQLKLLTDEVLDLHHLSNVVFALQNLWKKTPSFTCFDLYYRLHVRQLELTGEYAQLLALTTLSEDFLRDLKINNKRFDHPLNLSLSIYSCFRNRETENGLRLAQENPFLFVQFSDRWMDYQEGYFLLAMQSRDYALAFKLIGQTEGKLRTHINLVLVDEKWYIYQTYLEFIHPGRKNSSLQKTDLTKQKLPNFYKDKQGYNIAIIILQFCQYLQNNQKAVLYKKADIYKKYMERHLGSEQRNRERMFFLLLLLIIRNDFNYEQITKKSAKLLGQLKQCMLPGGACVSKIEIVPYEHLWKYIMEVLYKMKKV